MDIFDRSEPQAATTVYSVLEANGSAVRDFTVQVEHELLVFVNGAEALRIVCTPEHLVELVLGRLLTSGTITDAAEVLSVHVCQHSSRVHVELAHPLETPASPAAPGQTAPFGAPQNSHTPLVTTYSSQPVAESPVDSLSNVRPIPWDPAWAQQLALSFAEDTPMHRATRGAHSCRLAVGPSTLFCCEDLGRHNALDKAVGYALRHGVDLRQAILFTSGRVPVDMAAKVIRAGVPIFVTAAVPTDRAVELAKKHRLTLVAGSKRGSLCVFNDGWRGCAAEEQLGCMRAKDGGGDCVHEEGDALAAGA